MFPRLNTWSPSRTSRRLGVYVVGNSHDQTRDRDGQPGDGTFTDVTEKTGVNDPRWSTGAAFGDYDRDGHLDLFVANYVDFKLTDLPKFGNCKFCEYLGLPVQCGPRGLPGAGDSHFHNNGDGTFTNVSVKAGVSDPDGRYGLGVTSTDVDGDGWPDLYVANDSGPKFLYHNNRNGTFTEMGFLAPESRSARTEASARQSGSKLPHSKQPARQLAIQRTSETRH